MKNIVIAVVGLVLLGIVWGGWQMFESWQVTYVGGIACTEEARMCPDGSFVGRTGPKCEFSACPEAPSAGDYKNASYLVDGLNTVGQTRLVKLVDGVSSIPEAPGSASMITTRYFGNDVFGDLNGDGEKDVAFILTQSGSGSGTFYYLVSALKTDKGYTGTNSLLLGDRVAPQASQIRDDIVIANFAKRKPGEPMTVQPSVGVSLYAKVVGNTLTKISQPAPSLLGTIVGTVSIGPTCPVMRIPPDAACADKPFATKLAVTSADGERDIKLFSSDADGTFSVSVPVGDYEIRSPLNGPAFPRCVSEGSIYVTKGALVNVTVLCDSGIR